MLLLILSVRRQCPIAIHLLSGTVITEFIVPSLTSPTVSDSPLAESRSVFEVSILEFESVLFLVTELDDISELYAS
jgi:hypothetical protein